MIYYTNGDIGTKLAQGVALTYSNGAVCPASGEKYKFTVNVFCNATLDGDFNLTASGDVCAPYVSITSKYGCSVFDTNVIWEFLGDYEEFWGVFFIIGGVVLCFLGRRLMKPSICMAGMLGTIVLVLLFFYTIWFNNSKEVTTFWYFFAGATVAGAIVGFLLAKFVKVGAAVLGGLGGFFAGLILNEAVLAQFKVEWLFWVSIVACIIAGAVLTFFVFDHVVILSTVSIGSYGLVRGVSMYAGHYYNEFTMAKMIKEGLLEDIDPYYWCYVAGFVVFFLAGACLQYRQLKQEKLKAERERHPYQKNKDHH